jgi:hypothetical protein
LNTQSGQSQTYDHLLDDFLPIQEWLPYLNSMPDQRLASYLELGIQHVFVFRIGFNRSNSLCPAEANLPSASLHTASISSYIQEELTSRKLVVAMATQISPIGLIPKKGRPNKFRMIVDLSSPKGQSVNDGIDPSNCSFHYSSITDAAKRVVECGRGALMAKLDLKSAYRMVPVHPEDSLLLGIRWGDTTYVDRALPFGLRSAPIIFSAVADGLAWALFQNGVHYSLHYLDDFFFCEPASSPLACSEALSRAIPVCERLGLPVAPEKVEGPTTSIRFLGINIDSMAMTLSLPQDKLLNLKERLDQWGKRKSASKRQLQELLGHLNHAATVVRPGRAFLRALIEAMKRPRNPHQMTRLNSHAQADILWWQLFIHSWNGISILPPSSPSLSVISDASGSWGCGAFVKQSGEWLVVAWPAAWASTNIAVKELLPIVLAAAIWGRKWAGHHVHFMSDNTAVVAALTSRKARHPNLVHLLRCMFFFQAIYNFEHSASHIAGKYNTAADALSRNNSDHFLSIVPQAFPNPAEVPPQTLMLLTDTTLHWTSPRWERLFRASFTEASQPHQTEHMHQTNQGTTNSVTVLGCHCPNAYMRPF